MSHAMTLRQTESLRFRSTFDTGMKEDSINMGSFRESHKVYHVYDA
jgi:hypothetical protein